MKNKGRSQHRFKDNPLEKKFANAWERINSNQIGQTLDYLLAENPCHPNGEVTKRDREVAATVIQWLGSPVGQHFVESVLPQSKNQK